MRTAYTMLSLSAAALLAGCNSAPLAIDDEATTAVGTPVDIPVLANDSDRDGDPMIVKDVSGVNKGRAAINSNNTVRYEAGASPGDEVFRYRVADNHGKSSTAKVKVTVLDKPAPADRALPAGSVLDAIIVTFRTRADDKNKDDGVRVSLRRGDQVVVDQTFGAGEVWAANSSRSFDIDLKPDLALAPGDTLRLDVQKLGAPAGSETWVMAPEVRARLANGREVTWLRQAEAVTFGGGQPVERSWTLVPGGR
jgi:hypothetical protein